ncbi:hypothetical protein PQX77_006697, partial [Marasmius sp. AFHP31]
VSEWWSNWSFDVNAKTWHYDIARASLEPHYELFDPRYYTPTPLPPRATPPRLVDNDIITCFEKTFGDALYLWASCGRLEHRDHSLHWQHGLLTFGAVVHKYGILAHFPSTPNPEWAFENRSGIRASYSEKVSSRVDFLPDRNSHNVGLELCFSLRFPLQECNRLRAAYLCQSNLPHDEWPDLALFFIDEISVVITRDFSPNLPPAYLFVPPLCVTLINGMYCIPYPLCNPCFYWAVDPAGINVIPEEEWDKYGIPKLAAKIRKGYEPTDGKRYAQDHGYPELILGDPHDQRMIDLNGSKCDSEHTLEREQAPLPPRDERTMTRWVKGPWGFLNNAYIGPSRDESNLPRAASEAQAFEVGSSGSDYGCVDGGDAYESIRQSAGDHKRRRGSSFWVWLMICVVTGARLIFLLHPSLFRSRFPSVLSTSMPVRH